MSQAIPDSANLAATPASVGRVPIPAGVYNLAVLKAEYKTEKNAAHGSVYVTYQVVDGAQKGRQCFDTFRIIHSNTEYATGQKAEYNALCKAVGRPNEQQPLNLNGKVFTGELTIKTDKATPQYPNPEPYNAFKKYNPLAAPGSAAVKPAAGPARPAAAAGPARPATPGWGAQVARPAAPAAAPVRPVAPVVAVPEPITDQAPADDIPFEDYAVEGGLTDDDITH